MKRLVVLLLASLASFTFALPAQADTAPSGPLIYVSNQSTVLSDALIQDAMTCFQRALTNDFAPAWNAPGQLVWGVAPPGARAIIVSDFSDAPGALAYHTVINGAPVAKVFARTNIDSGYNWEVAFTHELWEMQADPFINRFARVGAGKSFWMIEVGDPVEDDSLAYWKMTDGGNLCAVSDFVTENWYTVHSVGPYDFLGYVHSPLRVLPGGYQIIWRNGHIIEISADGHLRHISIPELIR